MIKQNCPFEARTRKGHVRYLDLLREIARNNRLHPTEAENIFWRQIVRKDNSGYHFLRQKPVGRYILDFYCSEILLAIEIDGDSHDNKKNQDIQRDIYLEQRGIKTIRYTNTQVLRNTVETKNNLRIRIKQREEELISVLPCQREN